MAARWLPAWRNRAEPVRLIAVRSDMFMRTVLSLTFLLTAAQHADASLTDRDVARFSHDLLLSAGPLDKLERAAFVVQSANGTFDLVRWPRADFFASRWKGRFPEGAVAVIHTHPTARPKPSAHDRAEAQRVRLPFYVVSRAALCVTDSAGSVSCARTIPWLRRNGMTGEVELNWAPEEAG
jgi:hypothetical protein